jgi:hypothetical protein
VKGQAIAAQFDALTPAGMLALLPVAEVLAFGNSQHEPLT